LLSTCSASGDWRQCKYGQVSRYDASLCAFYLRECNHCRSYKAQKECRENDAHTEVGV
jgi:hypothetical protein